MRAPTFLLATLVAMLGCSSHVLQPVPTGDGYGPAGGGEHSSGSSTGSSSGGSTSSSGGGGSGSSSGGGTGSTGSSGGGSSGGTGSTSSSGGAGSSSGTGSSGGSSSSSGGSGSGGFDAGTFDAGGGHDGGASGDGGDVAALLPLCAGQINEFRNQNGEGPLTESSTVEKYAAAAATSDAHNGQLHSYFYASNGGGGVAATEDELDGAKIAPGSTAQQTMEQGLLNDEQANGGAAANLLDNQFSSVGCGFGQDASGNWWVVIGLQ